MINIVRVIFFTFPGRLSFVTNPKSYYTVTKSKVKDNPVEMLKQGNGFLIIPYLINNMTSV